LRYALQVILFLVMITLVAFNLGILKYEPATKYRTTSWKNDWIVD
jgi:hypothetical protein